jgi:hypothetical protein
MRPRLGLLLLPLLIVAWFVGASPASAHASLVGSNPSAGTDLTKAPNRLLLTFSDSVHGTGTAISVTDASGAQLQVGKPTINDTVVSQRLKTTAVPGTIRVVWRVASADGHPATGNFDFSLNAASATTASTLTSQSASSGNSDDSTSWGTSLPSFQTPTNKTNNEPLVIIGLTVLAIIVIGGVAALVRLRARGDDDDL